MKLVVLEKDGPLVDSLTRAYNSTVAIFRHYGLEPPTLADYRENITPDFMQFYWERGIPLYVTARELNRVQAKCDKKERISVQLQPGAKELLLHCQKLGFKIFLASSDTDENTLKQLEELGVQELITGYAINVQSRRDDLLGLLTFAIGLFPEDNSLELWWYIGDTATGIAAAKSIPIKETYTIALTGGFDPPERFEGLPKDQAPDHTVASPFDILPILDAYAHLEEDRVMHRKWTVN